MYTWRRDTEPWEVRIYKTDNGRFKAWVYRNNSVARNSFMEEFDTNGSSSTRRATLNKLTQLCMIMMGDETDFFHEMAEEYIRGERAHTR